MSFKEQYRLMLANPLRPALAACSLLLARVRMRQPMFPAFLFAWRVLRTSGPRGLAAALVTRASHKRSYSEWIELNESPLPATAGRLMQIIALLPSRPRLSVVMPVYDPPIDLLRQAIESVRAQIYENWELCIADDCSTNPAVGALLRAYAESDKRIHVAFREANGHISRASNSALELATGDWIAPLDHDDLVSPDAFAEVAISINDHPSCQIIYSDEDKISENGVRYQPYFKPDFSRELLRSQNYLNHLTVHRAENIRRVGGWRTGFEGSQDYDLTLRILEGVVPSDIVHLPKVLYHWRSTAGSTARASSEKSYAYPAGLRALSEHLSRIGNTATVEEAPSAPFYRVRPELPGDPPLVTIIIPTRNGTGLLRRCVESILQLTSYPNFEILIIDNGSDEIDALALLSKLDSAPNIRVLQSAGEFNYSALNNSAVAAARGSVLALLNNDIEVISADWLSEMVSWAMQPDIGCVGAKLYYPNDTIQHAGVVVGLGGVAGHSHKHFRRDEPGYFYRLRVVQNISAVTAACIVVRKSIYEQVGGLDAEHLPVAFNDVDFCLRVRDAGFNNVWTPYAELYHHESATRGADDQTKAVRVNSEIAFMRSRWGAFVDPYYSPNLTLDREDFSIGPGQAPCRVGIAAIFKNEHPYIVEWLAYHRVLGVRDFFIAEDKSDDGSTALLERLHALGLVKHLPIVRQKGKPPQLPAYAALMRQFGRAVDWMAFIDADEFLLPRNGSRSVASSLNAISATSTIGAIAVNWAVYGSSNRTEPEPAPVVERFGRRAEESWLVNHHYKSIVRTDAFLDTGRNPHYLRLKPGYVTVNTDGLPVVDHDISVGLSRRVVWDYLRLNHYVIKSRAEFLANKLNKGNANSDNQPKGQAYFDHHDRNEINDPLPTWLLEATKTEMRRIETLVAQSG